MTKPDGVAPETNNGVSSVWGTWEELLLAFAVNRHGTGAWDSIASELQKRTSDPNLCLTANNCRSKYLDLKRRFIVKNGDLEDGRDEKSNVDEAVPLLEELRKLRVAELRREVQRYDLNIESLELKMKKMEEEREKGAAADLENKIDKRDSQPEAATAAGEATTAATESEKDRLSVNESKSTDPRAEKLRIREEGSEPAGARGEEVRNDQTGQTSDEPAELKLEPDQKSDSCNGSSNSIEDPDRKAKKAEPEADSDRKENSDVQSSASRSRKEGSDKVRRGSTSGDEREREDQSRAVKEFPAESQPLADFLQAIRAPKLGTIFERRLRSQETSKYRKLILQHIDFETVETKLKEGWYSGSAIKLFRDLLLLVNNAVVFFGKNSPEASAAAEIRHLISYNKHLLQTLSLPKKEESQPSPSLIVCRKRSSIAAKASTAEEKQNAEEPKITKKRTREAKKNGGNNNGRVGRKSRSTSLDTKKGNVLNRMSNNGVLVDALKNTPLTSGKGGSSEQKKKTVKMKEKRNVGRPPKRGVGRRSRDRDEGEGEEGSKKNKKSRKL